MFGLRKAHEPGDSGSGWASNIPKAAFSVQLALASANAIPQTSSETLSADGRGAAFGVGTSLAFAQTVSVLSRQPVPHPSNGVCCWNSGPGCGEEVATAAAAPAPTLTSREHREIREISVGQHQR